MSKPYEYSLRLGDKENQLIPVLVHVNKETTLVSLDCSCCGDLLKNRLPSGVLIPIARTLKSYFSELGFRNTSVQVRGLTMERCYNGSIDEQEIDEMFNKLETSVQTFLKKQKKR
jgi:hypothetical protein